MVFVDSDDVGMSSDRPERPEGTAGLEVNGRLIAHTLEVGPPHALSVEKWVAQIDVSEFDVLDRRDGGLGEDFLAVGSGDDPAGLVIDVSATDLQIDRDHGLRLLGDRGGNAHLKVALILSLHNWNSGR